MPEELSPIAKAAIDQARAEKKGSKPAQPPEPALTTLKEPGPKGIKPEKIKPDDL
jgi:hypothetical protein